MNLAWLVFYVDINPYRNSKSQSLTHTQKKEKHKHKILDDLYEEIWPIPKILLQKIV